MGPAAHGGHAMAGFHALDRKRSLICANRAVRLGPEGGGKNSPPRWGMNQLPPPRVRRGGGRLAAFLYSPRGRARRGPAPGLVDSDLLARNGALTSPRARPRDRCRLLLRRPREDQRLHGRLPG